MLTVLELLIIAANVPALVWALLPVRRVPRLLDFMPAAAVAFLILHLFIDSDPLRLRIIPIYIFTVLAFLLTIKRLFRHNPCQPKRRVLAAAGRISALLALAACVSVPVLVLPFYPLTVPTGNFNVGTVVCSFTDKSRIEAFSDEAGKFREIAVQFWYPADRSGSGPLYDISGAPVSVSEQAYPVLIFSHGAFGVRKSNVSTFRELASHGYIVASIDHTYHSFYTSFPDGRTIAVNPEFFNDVQKVSSGNLTVEEDFRVTHEWLKLRTADIELVMDSLESGGPGKGGELLEGHMDLSKIGIFGHSLGGAAAAQVCRERKDAGAAIVLDGTMIGDITGIGSDGKETITDKSFPKPLMLMYGALFHEPEAKATGYLPNIKAFDNAAGAVYSLCIKDSGHLNFTDLPRISPVLSGMLGVGSIDSEKCIKIVNAYTLAFFDKHLKGLPSALLDGTDGYEEVEFDKRLPAVSTVRQ